MYTVKTLPPTASLPLRQVVTNTATGKRSTVATNDQRAAVATFADVALDRISQPKGFTADKRAAYIIATPRNIRIPRQLRKS